MRSIVVLFSGVALLSAFSQLASHSPTKFSHSSRPHQAFDTEADRIAELKVKNEPQFSATDGALELQRQADGHFYADVRINGAIVHMLVDTGASGIALSRDDAQIAGIATSIGMNDVVGDGADGPVHGEYARLERVELGPLSATGLDAVILNSGSRSLLGQSFLSRFASVHIEGDQMVLRPA